MKKEVLGIKIDDVSEKEALELVKGWLEKSGRYFIATPNPEMIVNSQTDLEFKKILNDTDLSIPDGVGLRLAGVKNRVAGTDFMLKLISLAEEKAFVVGLLGGQNGVADKTAKCLLKKFPRLKISYAISGPVIPAKAGNQLDDKVWIPDQVRDDERTDILFVAFGHGKQEKWIANNLDKVPVKVAMGVGGAFDYISGKIPRAPKWIRSLGLEWLFRLILQPWRIRRQFSLIKFILLLGKTS